MKREVTILLNKWSDSGDRAVLDELFPIIYKELRNLAAYRLKGEKQNHTLQPTELAHEAYLKLVDQDSYGFKSRTQFFALAARMMRNILVDHAKSKQTVKRGGEMQKVSLEKTIVAVPEMDLDIIALDNELINLAKLDETKCYIVELKFFGGLTTNEISEVVGKSVATVEREWAFSRAWLNKKLKTYINEN
jgi:RNA polymerase sigma factor (TIGR02999 family)